MSKLGIVGPYAGCEQTHAAIALATHAIRRGHSVSWLSPDGKNKVQRGWDHRVDVPRRETIRAWMRRQTKLIFFRHHTSWLADAITVGRQTVLVVPWHDIRADSLQDLTCYDALVASSRAVMGSIRSRLPKTVCRLIPFAGGLPATAPREPGHRIVRFYMYLDSYTVQHAGRVILSILSSLSRRRPELELRIGTQVLLPKEARDEMDRSYPRSGWYLPNIMWEDHVAEMLQADWYLHLSLRDNYGIWSLQALDCGAAVMGWDLAPGSEFLSERRNAKLLGCGLKESWLGATEVIPDYNQLEAGLEEVLDGHVNRMYWPKPAESVVDNRLKFHAGWEAVWG